MTIKEAIEILELDLPISHDDVKKAYRRKAKTHHPDKHRESISTSFHKEQFINAKNANELLLSHSELVLNSPGRYRDPVKVKRRASPRPAPKPPEAQWKFIEELDNVVKLLKIISRSTKKFKSLNISIQPGAWLGKMYVFLFEKRFIGEEFFKGKWFGVYRFIRLFVGSVFLIAGFIGISIAGMLLAAFVFPAFIVFQGIYTLYTQTIENQVKKTSDTMRKRDKVEWLNLKRKYLHIRTVPLFGILILSSLLIRFSAMYSFYFTILSLVFCIPTFILLLSVVYEWFYFYRVQNK